MKIKKIQYFIITKSIGLWLNCYGFFSPKKSALKAYQIFSSPRIGKLKSDNLPSFLQKATQETVVFNQHKIQTYTWRGNENIILLAHGWESNTSRWKKTMPYLIETKSTIIALDAPAHGLSNGKEFNAILYSEFIDFVVQKFKPQTLIGHSVGGMASFYHLYKNPNSPIKKIITLGAPSDLTIIFNNYVSLLSLNSKMRKALENYFTTHFNLQLDDFSIAKYAKTIQSKGILAHDKKDKIVLFSEAEKIAKNWPSAQFISTTGNGHSLHNEDLYKQIQTFILEV